MTPQRQLADEVVPLVVDHLKPRQLYLARSGNAAIRRLSRRVVRIDRLVRVARADSAGRPPLPVDDCPSGDWLLERAKQLEIVDSAPRPIIMGRHLLARGLESGPHFGELLDRCFEAQLDGAFHEIRGGELFLDRLLEQPDPASSSSEVSP